MENKERPTYWSVLPACVRYAPISAGAKLLYSEIAALTPAYGYCSARNEYFMWLYKKKKKTIQLWVDQLVSMGFVERVVIGNKRQLRAVAASGKMGGFRPPTVEEVAAYCQLCQYDVNPALFVKFYTSKGWKIGKNMMQDWRAQVDAWVERAKTEKPQNDSDWMQTLKNL